MKKWLKRTIYVVSIIGLIWIGLTLWVQFFGAEKTMQFGPPDSLRTALVAYNPDPIYDLDEQVCVRMTATLAESGYLVTLATTGNVADPVPEFDLYILCANTYNWAPDWKISSLSSKLPGGENTLVAALTLGSGSTSQARKKLEQRITENGCHLILSEELWLLRPNDEARMEEKNVEVACDMAEEFIRKVLDKMHVADEAAN